MDTGYSLNRDRGNSKWLILFAVILVVLSGIGYFVFGSNKRFISPLPEEPAMEIIFYTPIPEPITPTSSPSATPKAAKKPTATSKPEATVTPSKTVSITPTNKP